MSRAAKEQKPQTNMINQQFPSRTNKLKIKV